MVASLEHSDAQEHVGMTKPAIGSVIFGQIEVVTFPAGLFGRKGVFLGQRRLMPFT